MLNSLFDYLTKQVIKDYESPYFWYMVTAVVILFIISEFMLGV